MKKLLLCFALMPLFIACKKSPENQAKFLIEEKLKKTLHDYKSYEIVEFGKLDSSFTIFEELPHIKKEYDRVDEFNKEASDNLDLAKIYSDSYYLQDTFNKYMKIAQRANDSARSILKRIDVQHSKFKSEFNGWAMNHSFRAKNLNGNLGIHHYTYYFNSDLTEITDQVDIGEKSVSDNK